VSLAATPGANWTFAGWGGGCSGPGGCSVTLRGDAQVYAHFDPKPPPQAHLSVAVTGPGLVTGGGVACGNGASACDVTLAPGTAVTLTAAAASQARFTGWGGACSGNSPTCQINVQGDTHVSASFLDEVQTLVPNDGTSTGVLALNSTAVFFVRTLPDRGYAVWSVPKAGGTALIVAPCPLSCSAGGGATYMVADEAFVYWTDSYALYSAPVQGGVVSRLATSADRVGRLALDEGALYWVAAHTSPSRPGSIHRMQNRVDTILADGREANSGIAVDSTYVYFTEASFNGAYKAITRVPKMGGIAAKIVDTSMEALAVRVDSRNLYYREWTGGVWAAPKDGGTARLLSTGNSSNGGGIGSIELDVNAFVAWWNWNGTTGNLHGLFRANADGSGWTPVDTGADSTWFGPRVDDTAVYYFHGGALIKRLK